MDSFQTFWLLILIPFMLIYSLGEIKRGFDILIHHRHSLNFALYMRIKLLELTNGKDYAKKYEEQLLSDKKEMKSLALNSIIGGVVLLIVVFVWIFILYKSLIK